MLDLTNERKATDKEKIAASEVYAQLVKAGYTGTYAGGSKSKGQGFWVGAPNGKRLGYMNCRSIKSMLK